MRYELNFDEDKVNDVLDKGGASYDLKGCCKIMNEQQDTIFKLQDLCGQSDGENSRLRTVNKNLKEINKQLREINKELGDDLYNCRLNKNIITEKLKLWQDTLAEYDIYTIKDLGESFELDAKISKEMEE